VSRRARIGIFIALAGIVVAALGVFYLTRIVQQTLAPPPAPTPIPAVTEGVLVATRDIPLGGLLNSEDLIVQQFPVELIPRDALRTPETAIGRFTSEELTAGEVILETNLADPTNVSHDLAFLIGPDQVLMSFPATDLMSQLNILNRGDLIDILVTVNQEVEVLDERGRQLRDEDGNVLRLPKDITFDALQRVSVQAVIADVIQENQRGTVQITETGQVTETGEEVEPVPAGNQEVRVRAYLLAINPQDALVLKYLIDTGGRFDLVLRNPNANQLFELDPVFDEYLQDRYQLRVPR
jgi:Flp pilus assembly protein CpaB